MTFNVLHWSVVALSAVCAVVHAPPRSLVRVLPPAPKKGVVRRIDRNTVEVQGVRVRARAYVSRYHTKSDEARYEVEIVQRPFNDARWRLVDPSLGFDLDWPMNAFEAISAKPYRKQQHPTQATCELRQVDTREERVTFYNLDIKREMGLGFLTVTKAQTATTPDGVTVTLPVQSMLTSPSYWCYNGPPDVVCMRVVLSPGGRRRVLPASALYQRYKVPVNLYVRAAAPLFTNSRADDNPVQDIHITTPDKQATHLDTLTLVIRQVADLQTIPLKFTVPIDRNRHD